MTTETVHGELSLLTIVKRWSSALILLGTLLISVSAVGLWVEWTILSESGFVSVSTDVLQTNETRASIARAIVDKMFEDQPILKQLVRSPIEGVIEGLLGSSLFNTALEFISKVIWESLFVGRSTVVLDISGLRTFVHAIVTVLAPDLADRISPDQLPAELVLVDSGELPDLSSVATFSSWVSLLSFILGTGLIVFTIMRADAGAVFRSGQIFWVGIAMVSEAMLLAILTFPTKSSLLLSIDNSTGRTIVGTTYGILVLRFYVVMFVLAVAGIVVAAYGLRKHMVLTRQLRLTAAPAPGPETAAPSPTPRSPNDEE